jgi:hypothetical protein
MQRDGLRRGVVTLCIGGDQGIARALKRLSGISAIKQVSKTTPCISA